MALIYPKTDEFSKCLEPFEFNEDRTPKLTLWVVPFDLDKDEFLLPVQPPVFDILEKEP
ncbi:MAG: hypothetical protein WCL34_12345 [Methylococcaceae bacterium]